MHHSLDSAYILQEALKEGSIPHRDDKFLIHGAGGVGKSSLIDMFLGTQRDLIRNSTPVATEPLHLKPVRNVSTLRFTAKWERVDFERHSCMVARTCKEFFQGKRNVGNAVADMNKPISASEDAPIPQTTVQLVTQEKNLQSFVSSPTVQKEYKESQPEPSENPMLFLENNPTATPGNIREAFTNFLHFLQEKVRNAKEKDEELFSHSIRIVDSGGQPQFHELIAIFLAHISGLISVFKLNEALSAHGEVVVYENNEPVNDPYESYYTHEQVIRHDLQAIQSKYLQNDMEEMPNLAFVGTFLDEQEKCSEKPDMKDKRLHRIITEILPPEMQESVITCGGSLKKVTFRINARTPEKNDFDTVDELKEALMVHSQVKPKDLPLKWHGYELALCILMEELKRQSLHRKECEFIGYKLGFDLPSLNAALDYMRELNIIAYYDVLPDVIFGSSQVILDKITELVHYSLMLKKGQRALSGAQRKFVQQGIVSLQFLHSHDVKNHYIPELFQPEDLLKVLISQLVVSAVGAKEFIMPCVLEVSGIYPSPQVTEGNVHSSFILHFSKKSPMFGVYCCTISSLMTDAGWKLLTDDGEVVQVARNSFVFEMPSGFPGKLTFSDPISSYLEVILELPADLASKHCVKLYPEIRNTIFDAVKKAMKTLHYEVQVPDVSFMCPEKKCSRIPHPGIVEGSLGILKCSLKPGSIHVSLTEEQKIWLPKGVGKLLIQHNVSIGMVLYLEVKGLFECKLLVPLTKFFSFVHCIFS